MEQLLKLEKQIFSQDFEITSNEDILEQCKYIAKMYSVVENSIAVLSDIKNDRSYIYKGEVSKEFALSQTSEIDSIWEEEIYNLIHPDDIKERHLLELQFFHLLRKTPIVQRVNYRTSSIVRMLNREGRYVNVLHRTFYLQSQSNGSLWIALCLYNFATNKTPIQQFEGFIQNTATSEIIKYNYGAIKSMLSEREKELLALIEYGLSSKEIALKLGISKNTVDRHRQNIMEKLRARNCTEAIKIVHSLDCI